jgi:hypothetical protein
MDDVSNPGKIYAAMSAVMLDVDPIAKDRKNAAQGYQFRGIDDVYQALQSILGKHGVFTTSEILSERTEERKTSKGSDLIYRVLHIRWRFYASDGSFVTTETIGEGMDSGDKASNKAMSVAHKYALLQAFCIPTDDPKDPENDSHELKREANDGTASNLTLEWTNAVRAFQDIGKTESMMLAYISSREKKKIAKQDLTQKHIDELHKWYTSITKD